MKMILFVLGALAVVAVLAALTLKKKAAAGGDAVRVAIDARKITDFGIGGVASRQAIEQNTRGTTRGLFLATALRGSCTPLYAGPQQMRGEAPDPRDDVYSLGVVWYQMLTGDLTAGRPGGTRWGRRLEDAGLDRDLVELLGECFEDDLADRISDAGTLARKLDAHLSNATVKPVVIVKPVEPPKVTPRVEPQLALLVEQRDQAQHRERAEWERQRAELQQQQSREATAWARLGELNRHLGDHAQAISDCTEAIRIDPSLARAYSTRGSAHRMRGQLDLAIADCGEAIRLDPAAVLAYFNRGEAYRLRRDLDKAIADFTRAIELNPKYAGAYSSRGIAKRGKGDLDGAIADFTCAIELDPKLARPYFSRGIALYLQKSWLKAYGDFDAASRQEKPFDDGALMACVVQTRLGQGEAGRKELRAQLDKRWDSKPGDWVSQIGGFLLGTLDEAVLLQAADSPDAHKTREQHCEAWYFAGMQRLAAGQKAEAASCFRKCIATEQKADAEYQFATAELKWLGEK